MLPLDLLREWLKQLDEVQLCELLDIASEDLVLAFGKKILERREYLEKEMEIVNLESGVVCGSARLGTVRELDLNIPAWEEYNTGYYDND